MSVSAAELPQMSGALGDESEVADVLRARLNSGLRQIAFFVVPSVAAFLILGDVVVGAIYRTGRFTQADVIYVWGILAGATVGLLASTLGRLYSSTYYALRDTRTPLRFAIVRVVLTTALGYLCAIPLAALLGIEASLGCRRPHHFRRNRFLGRVPPFAAHAEPPDRPHRASRGLSRETLGARWWRRPLAGRFTTSWDIMAPILLALLVLGPYGIIYFGGTWALGLAEARALFGRLLRTSRTDV